MAKRFMILLLLVAMLLPVLPASAQDTSCGNAPPSRLVGEGHAQLVAGMLVSLYDAPGGNPVGELPASSDPIYLVEGPQCSGDTWWWQVEGIDYYSVWAPENVGAEYVLEPYRFFPAPPVALGVPMSAPVMTAPEVPLPSVNPAGNPQTLQYNWDWQAYTQDAWIHPPDPMALQLPAAYAGDLPALPVNLDNVYFVADAALNAQQLALLAQNGFVVVPGGLSQFDNAYYGSAAEAWPHQEGQGDFITTDALLHSLFLTYQNTLMFLEMNELYGRAANVVAAGYQAAERQAVEAAGTPLEAPARAAAVYYAVALTLLADGEPYFLVGYEQVPGFKDTDLWPSQALAQANPAILEEARPVVEMVRAAQGRLALPGFEDYEEDFSQYAPRSYYAGNPLLESYFRAMMWLGRITFRARSETDTLAGLLVLRALKGADYSAYNDWAGMAETLNFLVGPTDDYSPIEYLPLAEQAFGAGLPLDALADPARLATFLESVAELPGPRINSIPLPMGTGADEVDPQTRGFRLFGQRFTLDGYIMQQLIYPEVGVAGMERVLPLGLDVAAVLGSDRAYVLAEQAGATAYANYTEHVAALRGEVNGMSGDAWLDNLYGGWLWTLQPLLVRDPALVPPMMQTDAWQTKDIHTVLGSWTQLKHATLLYAEQPMGGLGGGGMVPPLVSTSYVEPNPLVFARIAIVAATLDRELDARGYYNQGTGYTALSSVHSGLNSLALLAARLAGIARQEVAGEPVSYDELHWMQEQFGANLWQIRYTVEEWVANPPETLALVADVATNADAGLVLEEAIGPVDYIYVIANGPNGLHLTRGAVYSYYEFTQPIDQRLTDDAWRAMVASGNIPPRPAWTSLYFSE